MTSPAMRLEEWSAAEPSAGRVMALSARGDIIAVKEAGGLRLIDASGQRAAVDLGAPDVLDFVWSGERLWVAGREALVVYAVDGARLATRDVAEWSGTLLVAPGGGVLLAGDAARLARLEGGAIEMEGVGEGEAEGEAEEVTLASLGGLRTLRARGRAIRVTDPGRELHRLRLPGPGQVAAAAQILDGAAIAVASRSDGCLAIDVVRLPGGLVHHIEIDGGREIAFAAIRGLAVAVTDADELVAVNLRYGNIAARAPAPLAGCHVDVDEAAAFVALCGPRRDANGLSVFRLGFDDLFAGSPLSLETGAAPANEDDVSPSPSPPRRPTAGKPQLEVAAIVPPELDVSGFAPAGGRSPLDAAARRSLLEIELAYLRAVVGRLIADKWRGGELGHHHHDQFPHESEVLALARGSASTPSRELLDRRIEELDEEIALAWRRREEGRQACESLSPLEELTARFGLTALEGELLMVVSAPALDPASRRLFAIATGGDGWATESLVRDIVGITGGGRADVAISLEPLTRGGLVELGSGPPATRAIEPAAAVLELLVADRGSDADDVGIQLYRVPREAWRQLEACLGRTSAPRIAVRGRPGRGRRALARYLVEAASNRLHVIDLERLGPDREACLGRELTAARIRGDVPCVIDLGASNPAFARIVSGSMGPLIACIDEKASSPLSPGAPIIDLGRLGEGERMGLWRDLLGDSAAAAELARRFEVPPQAAIDAAASAGGCLEAIAAGLETALGEALGSLADRIAPLPSWDEVILPDEIAASLRELIDRRRCFDLVASDWGLAGALRSARGLIALFAGPSGTGKTLAAGLVARELGRDLYRIDVSRIVSKWVGETEKQLAAVFDAAESAGAVLLFDEADSLFAKRGAVKGASDRYANLQVNYLLQRLDTFRGVAILTTNQGSAIDPAFRRRLTTQLTFSLPDEETRELLWQAHRPPGAPTAGDIDFAALARDYPLSGGSIRNIAVRAAFLAAGEGAPLADAHYQEAIRREYRERGKLSASGRLE